MKLKTAAKVWLYLSEIFAKPISECSEEEKHVTCYGVCWAVHILWDRGYISKTLYRRLETIIQEDVEYHNKCFGFFLKPSPKNRILRSDYCYLLYCQGAGDRYGVDARRRSTDNGGKR